MASDDPLRVAVSVVSETLIPGASNMLKGDFKDGAIYAAAGFLAKSLFGLPGLVLVAASSIAKATTGMNVTDVLLNRVEGAGTGPKSKAATASASTK
jgi:hypothetical protein